MMEPQHLGENWRALVSKVSNEAPEWFYAHLQEVMKYVYFELEGIDIEALEEHEGKFFSFDDCFDWVTDRSQLVKDLKTAIHLFSGMSNFSNMDPSESAKPVVANR